MRSGEPDPVGTLVKGYLIERVRSLADADPELFAQAFELYDTLERHQRSEGGGPLRQVKEHPVLERLLSLLGRRAHHVYQTALRIAKDDEKMSAVLRARLAEAGIDPSTPEGFEEATSEYERVLRESVPLATSLDNIAAVAEAIELGNDFLNARNPLKRAAFKAGWAVLLPLAIRDPELRDEVDALKSELSGDRQRLAEMARLVRREGPRIVRSAYEAGGEAR